jgi:NADH dehydrogenase [ubiquinone] 1 alpha subcomplex assembly factor 6
LYDSGAKHAHPLFPFLSEAVNKHNLTRRFFERIIEARDNDLEGAPPADMEALESYADATVGSLLHLMVEILGPRDANTDEILDQAVSHIGKGVGISNIIRSISVHSRAGQRYIPDTVMNQVRQPPSHL